MLTEFRQLEEANPRLMERVTELIARLLRDQFIHVDDRGSASLLDVLYGERVQTLVRHYFDVAGYQLMVRESDGWAGLIPDVERVPAARMRIDETLVLLVLRRLWEDGVHDGDIQPRGAVLLTLNEAHAAYEEIVSRARRAALQIGPFREVVRQIERRALVRLGEYDDETQDMELTIRPIVAEVVGDNFLAHLEQLLERSDLRDPALDEAVGAANDPDLADEMGEVAP